MRPVCALGLRQERGPQHLVPRYYLLRLRETRPFNVVRPSVSIDRRKRLGRDEPGSHWSLRSTMVPIVFRLKIAVPGISGEVFHGARPLKQPPCREHYCTAAIRDRRWRGGWRPSRTITLPNQLMDRAGVGASMYVCILRSAEPFRRKALVVAAGQRKFPGSSFLPRMPMYSSPFRNDRFSAHQRFSS